MNSRTAAIVFSLIAYVAPLAAAPRPQFVFDAKVVRIEPWGAIKISCGVALVTRMAEYEVRAVYRGHIETQRVIVRHPACNGDELDDLKPGDEVIVVATELPRPERHTWMGFAPEGETRNDVLVRFNAVEVAKSIFPTIAPGHAR
jgi:hypothetical protein